MIHVCSLAHMPATVEETGARHIITVMGKISQVQRPSSVNEANHLMIAMDDITAEAEGFNAPNEGHVQQVLAFVRRWDRATPMVVHCYAGISRSTASAFVAACALNPARSEAAIAHQIRDASPFAWPNPLIVSIADRQLGREGRMVRALHEIGPGDLSVEGRPFRVDLE